MSILGIYTVLYSDSDSELAAKMCVKQGKEVLAAKTNQALFILGETPAFTAIIPIPANR